MQSTEKWLPVVGYEGIYEVSDRGNVRSLDRISPSGACRKGRVLKQSIDKTGYARVGLFRNGRENFRVHRLVAASFHGPSDLPHVRHLDSVKLNNVPSNLAWGTASENMHDNVVSKALYGMKNTHCPDGHEYTDDNTYFHPNSMRRRCRICQAARLAMRGMCDICGMEMTARAISRHKRNKHGSEVHTNA